MHSTPVSRKYEVHIIPESKEYINPVVIESKLIKFNSISNPILIVSKCSKLILSKFKTMKFILE